MTTHPNAGAQVDARSAWRIVLGLGIVSLAADMVYEGARSITGPLLQQLGVPLVVAGLVTGVGEAAALVLRLPFGARADRSGRYWPTTVAGYALTAVAVPLLAVTPSLGAAGAVVACALVLAERVGKAVRSPSKSVLLARAAEHVGLGRGFGIHKALDQLGAFAGPLLVAAVVALTGALEPAFAVLALPGAAAMVLLFVMRRRAPDDEPAADAQAAVDRGVRARWLAPARELPRGFWLFAGGAAASTAGLATFAVISYHLVDSELVETAVVPVVYAGAMLAAAIGALVVGALHDRWGSRVVLVVPVLVAVVPPLVFGGSLAPVLVGVGVWGLAGGLLDSTVKARVAELVGPGRRATAYGWFAAVQGVAAVAGGGLSGALATHALALLTALVVALQVAAAALMVRAGRADRGRAGAVAA
ncbi:MFS transporter [Cellulomonas alba]|uniref:MFS transporter n=1 Tax=Cellulomonas alba TaxID=3053467 RepID=A0ABT7SEA0_9CELL|nr:MFS transporter [Cellulomonas alba]MDM7854515.1 MFS transporter [Cellulomonas alba]